MSLSKEMPYAAQHCEVRDLACLLQKRYNLQISSVSYWKIRIWNDEVMFTNSKNDATDRGCTSYLPSSGKLIEISEPTALNKRSKFVTYNCISFVMHRHNLAAACYFSLSEHAPNIHWAEPSFNALHFFVNAYIRASACGPWDSGREGRSGAGV